MRKTFIFVPENKNKQIDAYNLQSSLLVKI